MTSNIIIGVVGKPSAGKSSFLNATTDSEAKVGSFPFTTIKPNIGITFFERPCPCSKYNQQSNCRPRYGSCENGTRKIPIKVLDVAGLIPDAHLGLGLGNKFLDDLRHSHVLLHVVDVSGTTNEKGETTKGADPLKDIDFLFNEITLWVFNNLLKKFDSLKRKSKSINNVAVSFLKKLSGYGCDLELIQLVCDKLSLKDPVDLTQWNQDDLFKFVQCFTKVRFPTVLVLNKIDHEDSAKNIQKISKKYKDNMILTSSLAELFLKKMSKEGYIKYQSGDESFETSQDNPKLKPLDEKNKKRLEKINDLILFRYGTTGTKMAIEMALKKVDLVDIYPVADLTKFHAYDQKDSGAFRDCILVPRISIRDALKHISQDMYENFVYAEEASKKLKVGEKASVESGMVIKFTTAAKNPTTYKLLEKPTDISNKN